MSEEFDHIYRTGCKNKVYHGRFNGSSLCVPIDVSSCDFHWPEGLSTHICIEGLGATVISDGFGVVVFNEPLDYVETELEKAAIVAISNHCGFRFKSIRYISPIRVVAKIVTKRNDCVFTSNDFSATLQKYRDMINCEVTYSRFEEV